MNRRTFIQLLAAAIPAAACLPSVFAEPSAASDVYRVTFPEGGTWMFSGYVLPADSPRTIKFHTVEKGWLGIVPTGATQFAAAEPSRVRGTAPVDCHVTTLECGDNSYELTEIMPPSMPRLGPEWTG